MAEAKQKGSRQTASKRRRTTAVKSKSQNGTAGSRSRGNAKPKSRGSTKPKRPSQSKARSKPALVGEAVEEKAKEAGNGLGQAGKSVGRAVKAARVPLLASGAAIAGVAGGAALASRQGHHRHSGLTDAVRKIESDDVARAARRVGDVSARVGRFAADFQRAREASNGAANGRHRSPIEVVLQGLTSRR
jgi:hypothetical protein